MLGGAHRRISRHVNDNVHQRQMRRLDHMHKEIVRIGVHKTHEFEIKKKNAENFLMKNRRKYRSLRSRKHDTCHICLADYEHNDIVSTSIYSL